MSHLKTFEGYFLLTRREMLRSGVAAGAFWSMNMRPSETGSVQALNAVDHFVLGVADLQAGIEWVEKATGVRAVIGGKHPGAGTRNALLSLGPKQYLEILAPDPEQDQTVSRFGDLKKLTSPRLLMWAAVAKDIDALAQKARSAAFVIEGPRDGSRARPDGKILKWRTLAVGNDIGVLIPFFIEWGPNVVHPSEDSPKGCKLTVFEMEHAEPDKVRETLQKLGIEAQVKQGQEPLLKATLDTPKGKVELR